jgi:hypothetical protein
VRKSILIAALASAMLCSSAYAQGEPGIRVFYNPFPLEYQRTLVKVIDGLMPGESTMRDAVDRYGPPHAICQERYFYWEWRTRQGVKKIKMDFFPSTKRFTSRHNVCGYDGRAVIKEIRAYDTDRMSYTTYMQDMINWVPYPYEIIFHSKENRYEMRFYEQGYSMFFNGDDELFEFESYYPHEDLVLRGVYHLQIGAGEFLYVTEDYWP